MSAETEHKSCVEDNVQIGADMLDAIIFDFDGVLTDNRVLLTQEGVELVSCSRADGLAFEVLNKVGLKSWILSTEQNPVVAMRGKKLRVPVIQGVANKQDALRKLAHNEKIDLNRMLFVGNDLNDLLAMDICGFSACPIDSHPKVVERATIVLNSAGGQGVARELVEAVLCIDLLNNLYLEEESHVNFYNR